MVTVTGLSRWNAAYEAEHYYSKTHILQRKWNFSNWLVSFSVVYLQALFPRVAYFLGLAGQRGKIKGASYKEVLDFEYHLVPKMATFTRALVIPAWGLNFLSQGRGMPPHRLLEA